MWAFVIWDARSRTFLASRDRVGIKPLVYHLSERRVAFASEIKGLRPVLGGSCDIDPQALHHYLSLMQVPAPHTIDRRIRKLQPARALTVGPRDCQERIYWRMAPGLAGVLDARESRRRLEALLHHSVRLRLIADVPVGCLLSGGVDSSVVTALAARAKGEERLTTFSIGFPGMPDVDETPWARRVAAHLGTEHVEIALSVRDVDLAPDVIRHYDEPFAVSSVLGVYLIARAARERVKILLSGDGGDELFAGYARYLDVDRRWDRRAGGALARLRRDRARAVNQWVRWRPLTRADRVRLALHSLRVPDERGRDFEFTRNHMMFTDAEKLALYTAEWRRGRTLDGTIDWLCSIVPADDGDRVLRRQRQDLQTTLPDEMLAKVDRATMAWGIEARVPLLDHRVVELALSLPPACRYGGGEGKRILKEIGADYVPREVLYREKRGFTIPLARWLDGELREFVRDTLAPAAVRRAGIFEPAEVAHVLALYARQPDFHTAHMLFTLLCFQVWYERQGRAVEAEIP
jgi:asparagine synthase (glutamine-hydrolysing)